MNVLMLNPPFKVDKGKYSTWSRSPAITKSGTVYYPIYLATATGILEEHGQEVMLIDACADQLTLKQVIQKLKGFEPRIAVLNTTTPSIYNDIKISQRLKKISKFKNVRFVFVGTHVSALPLETLKLLDDGDIIIIGEYDYILTELALAIEEGKPLNEVNGLLYKNKTKVIQTSKANSITTQDLETFPFITSVYKNHLNIKNYFFGAAQYPMVQIVTSRGCPNY